MKFWKRNIVLLTLLGTCILLIPPTLSLAEAANIAHEQEINDRFVRALMDDERYTESIAYLTDALGKMERTPSRFPLTLLLIEAQLNRYMVADAEEAIDEAFLLASSKRDSSKVWKLKGWAAVLSNEASHRDSLQSSYSSADLSLAATEDSYSDTTINDIRITNSFFESDLRMVLTDLSMEAGMPILYGGGLEGLVTFDAIDEPLEDVLESVLLPLGYTFRLLKGKYFVGSISPKDPAFALLSETEVVTLANISSHNAVMSMSDFFLPYVKSSPIGNSVVITAPPTIVERIRQDLRKMDKAPIQISIDVIVAEISHEGALQLGVDWSINNRSNQHPRQASGGGSPGIDNPALELNMSDFGSNILSNVVDVQVDLQTLLVTGDAKIRANPRITAMNGRPATIKLVRDEWFEASSGGNQALSYNTLQAISSGIQLNITAFVSDESSEITMYVFPQVGDVIGQNSEGLPRINTRSAETTVRVSDGETFTIGGLSLEIKETEERKIPLLGSIPFLGYLFRYTSESVRESEVVIFVTPRIV